MNGLQHAASLKNQLGDSNINSNSIDFKILGLGGQQQKTIKVVWCETLEHVSHALQSLWFACCIDARSSTMTLFGVVRLISMCRLSFSCIQFVMMPIVICQCRVSNLPLEAMSTATPKKSPHKTTEVNMQEQNDMERSTKNNARTFCKIVALLWLLTSFAPSRSSAAWRLHALH